MQCFIIAYFVGVPYHKLYLYNSYSRMTGINDSSGNNILAVKLLLNSTCNLSTLSIRELAPHWIIYFPLLGDDR